MRASGIGLTLLLGLAFGALADDAVSVPGSKTQFPVRIEVTVADKPVKMVLTGAAMRRKFLVNAYTVGSYIQEGVAIKSADDLAVVSCLKRLVLVLERDVSGRDMAEAFKTGIRLNHPEPAFAEEIPRLAELIQKEALERHDKVVLTHIPGLGMQCNVAGKQDLVIRNERFATAVWQIYLGKNNLGDQIKKNLFSRF